MTEEQLRLDDSKYISEEHSPDEIPPGYKKTEVGVIPEEWKVSSLDSIARVTSGKRLPPGRSLTDNITPYPYIRVSDLRWGGVSLNSIKYVPYDLFPSIRQYRIFEEDLFISVAGTLGLVGKIPPPLHGANLTENADRITDITCSKEYLMYYLMSPLVQNVIDSLKTVGAQPKLALTRIRKFVISLPSTEVEQRAIAEALTDVDNLIASLDNLISKKQSIKKATMQQLLTGRTRLPGFKQKWKVETLGKFGSCLRGVSYDPTTDLFTTEMTNSVRLLRANNVQKGIVEKEGLQFVNKNIVREDQILRKNDILLCMANGSRDLVGKTGLFDAEDGYTYSFGAFMGCFRCESKEVNPRFVFYLLNTKIFRDYIRVILSGSSINNLKPIDIEGAEFSFPDYAEQNSIVLVLLDIDYELQALKRRREKLKQIKQGMMQQLLTGRIRLLDKEAV